MLRYNGRNVVIDTTPDFRAQVLRAGLERLDAIVYTHAHADHILGLDDVRPFNYRQRKPIPVYATQETLAVLQRVFQYAFDSAPESSVPKLDLHVMRDAPFDLFDLSFTPIRLRHGRSTVFGFRFGAASYLTDHSAIPEESMSKLRGLDVLFLDALRLSRRIPRTPLWRRPCDWWKSFSLAGSSSLTCVTIWATKRRKRNCPRNVRLAYDGLEIEIEAEP